MLMVHTQSLGALQTTYRVVNMKFPGACAALRKGVRGARK